MTITAQLADGRELEFPDDTPPAVVRASVQKMLKVPMSAAEFKEVKAEGNIPRPEQFTPSGSKDISYSNPDMLQAHPLVRFAKGAAAPVLGAAQLGANVIGAGGPINERLAETEAMTQRGRAELGSTGIDWWNAGGQVLSPAALAATKLLTATSTPGRVVQGGVLGAAAGATEPVTKLGDYAGQKGTQIGAGAVVGGAIPAAWAAALGIGKGVRNVVQPYMGESGADAAAGRLLNDAVGPRREEVIQALKNAEPGVTAGQAANSTNSAEFQAIQQIAANRDPSKYFGAGGIEGSQNEARLAAVRSVGKTEADLKAAIKVRAKNAEEAYKAVENDLINPASDVAIMEGAIAGKQASKAEALRDWGRFTTTAAQSAGRAAEGKPGWISNADRVPEALQAAADSMGIAKFRQKQAEFLQNAMESLKETVGLDSRGLNRFLERPSFQAAVKDAMLSAQETGSYFPAAPGERFSVANLQRIKESLDAGILASKQAAANGKRPDLSEKELGATKDAFVSWLSNKSPGWRDARHQYAQDSVPINRMEIGQYLEKKLVPAIGQDVEGAKQSAATFSQALRDAPGTIKRSTGNPRFESLKDVLSEEEIQTLIKVRDELARDVSSKAHGKAGMEQASRKIGMSVPEIPPSGMFNPKISFARGVYNRVTGHATEKILDDLAKRMDSPQEVARIMEKAKPGERKSIAELLDAINRVRSTSSAN